jgi:hypothetical protein
MNKILTAINRIVKKLRLLVGRKVHNFHTVPDTAFVIGNVEVYPEKTLP